MFYSTQYNNTGTLLSRVYRQILLILLKAPVKNIFKYANSVDQEESVISQYDIAVFFFFNFEVYLA